MLELVILLAIGLPMATVAFGLRFSNMTNRGILTRGPYAWVRHPAYAAKALSWWVLSAPFLRGVGDTARLALWTGIYVARALTEERHLDAREGRPRPLHLLQPDLVVRLSPGADRVGGDVDVEPAP